MAEAEEKRALTPEDRRRNVRRAKRVEERLGVVEGQFGVMLYGAAAALAELHRLREELRAIFALEPLGRMAPLYEALAERAQLEEAERALLGEVKAEKGREAVRTVFAGLRGETPDADV